MHRRQEARIDRIGKNVGCTARRQVAVQPLHVGQAAAEHDDLWVEDVDDAGQRPSQAVFVAAQGGFAGGVARSRAAARMRNVRKVAGQC